MDFISRFLNGIDIYSLLLYIPAALICITIHECSHGYVAYKLGDPTAADSGRLSLNPIRHIDPIGLLLLIVAGFGWAKPVPVDMRYFKKPKRDMALTSLAGPVSNLLLAFGMLFLLSAFTTFLPESAVTKAIFTFLANTAQLSIGLGVFNLLPVSPLDGSKILFSILPDRYYYQILRYERYGFIVLIVILYTGVLNTPLMLLRTWITSGLWTIASAPFELISNLIK